MCTHWGWQVGATRVLCFLHPLDQNSLECVLNRTSMPALGGIDFRGSQVVMCMVSKWCLSEKNRETALCHFSLTVSHMLWNTDLQQKKVLEWETLRITIFTKDRPMSFNGLSANGIVLPILSLSGPQKLFLVCLLFLLIWGRGPQTF